MQINFSYDPSVAFAPAGFKPALAAAAQYLDGLITNPITVTIKVGWGEDNGAPITAGIATGGPVSGINLQYFQLKNDLKANATSATDATVIANLPVIDPTGGGNFYVTSAQEKAWGLLSANSPGIDGTIGFGTAVNFNYDPLNRAISGETDFIGVAEHEITHALGRTAGLQYAPNQYTPLDLFRFASPGVFQLTGGLPAYFSIDGGKTNLNPFDTVYDYADWASTVQGDSFGYAYTGTVNAVTQTDITEIDALGFSVQPPATPDLVANSVSLANTSIVAGGNTTMSYKILNSGNATAAASTSKVYLSADSVIDTADTLLATTSNRSLTPGSFETDSLSITVPSNLAPGTYWIGVIADANGQFGETNNVSTAVQITVTPAVPDLVADTVSVSSTSIVAGGTATVSYRILNSGSQTAATSISKVYLSTDGVIDASDTVLATSSDISLPPNTYETDSASITLPSNLAAGTYWIGVIADATGQFGETNNVSTPIQITVTDVPPAVVSVTASPATGNVTAGSLVTLTLTMSKPVTVTGGTPTLALNDGGTASYDPARSNSTNLVFDYTVRSGESTSALAVTGTSTNGATIADTARTSANLQAARTTLIGLGVNAPTGLTINVVYDASVANAPIGFKTTVAAAVAYLESQFSTPISITINVGYGEVGGSPLGSLGASQTSGTDVGYQTLRAALLARTATADEIAAAATLPVNDPTNGGSFYLSYAEAEALGLSAGPGPGVAVGSIGISSTDPITYATTNQAASGTFDAFGVVEHEITEVLGRTESLGSLNGFGIYTPLDLFRYASPGVRDLVPGPGSFSIDGVNLLGQFNNPLANGGDAGDWAASVTGDAFDASSVAGVASGVSPMDLRQMDVLGFTPATTGNAAPTVLSVTASPGTGNVTTGTLVTLTVTMSKAVTVSGGAPTLSLNDGGGATYDAAKSTAAALVFDYSVLASQSTTALAVTALNTNGATIRDATGNSAVLSGVQTSFPGLEVNISGGLINNLSVTQQLELIYVGYFNRAADFGGFNFWSGQNTQAQSAGQSAATALTNIANSFTPQPETIALYPFLGGTNVNLTTPAAQSSLTSLIGAVYVNLFGHTADPGGAAYWLGQITNGAVGLGAAILAIANGATGTDGIELQNKIAVALDFTTRTDAAGLGVAAPLPASFLTAAGGVLSGVDGTSLNDPSVTAGMDATTAYIAGSASSTTTTLAASASTDSPIMISLSNAVIDPGAGNHSIQFLTGATADTVVLHAGATDQIDGFDLAAGDRLDLRELLAAAVPDIQGVPPNLGAWLTIADQGADALLLFDPLGHAAGNPVAVLRNLGSVVTDLKVLTGNGAVQI